MPHVRWRHHPREPKKLDRGAGPVSCAEPVDCCRRPQEAWRARLSLDDPGHQALPAGLRSAAENRDVRPGAVRSDDGAIPALGSQSVVVDVRIPAALMIGERPKPFGEALGSDPITSTLIFGEYDAVLVDAMMRWLRP